MDYAHRPPIEQHNGPHTLARPRTPVLDRSGLQAPKLAEKGRNRFFLPKLGVIAAKVRRAAAPPKAGEVVPHGLARRLVVCLVHRRRVAGLRAGHAEVVAAIVGGRAGREGHRLRPDGAALHGAALHGAAKPQQVRVRLRPHAAGSHQPVAVRGVLERRRRPRDGNAVLGLDFPLDGRPLDQPNHVDLAASEERVGVDQPVEGLVVHVEVVEVQLALEAVPLRTAEVFRQHLVRETLLVADDEGISLRSPGHDLRALLFQHLDLRQGRRAGESRCGTAAGRS
eukprot:scaffold1166_cov261-Pinguiococcus_pyrenoidosus.AAC.68